MCFRPAQLDDTTPLECPNCGKRINRVTGVVPKKCPFCKFVFPVDGEGNPIGLEASSGNPPAPSAPKAPGAPVAPSRPAVLPAPKK